MTRRYVARPVGWWTELPHRDDAVSSDTASAARTVLEPEHTPRKTGLLDHLGNELFALDEMDRIGFVRHGRN